MSRPVRPGANPDANTFGATVEYLEAVTVVLSTAEVRTLPQEDEKIA